MSRMMVIGVRHDKIEDVEGLKLQDLRTTDTDYASPVLEKAGVIISGHHHSHDGDNILLTPNGVRYLNSADNVKFGEDVKAGNNGVVDGVEGLDIAYKHILKTEKVSHTGERNFVVDSHKITLVAFNTDDSSLLNKDVFKDIASFVKKNEDSDTLLAGNYIVENGLPIANKSPIKALATLNEDTMAMINMHHGMYSIIALPNTKVDLKSNMLERDLAAALGVEEKVERKLKLR